jgi:CheY-like chemotaxis protein
VTVDGDPVRLEQVVCNLIQNAVKYTPAGGTIDVALAREDGEAVLRVRDSGVGIPPAMLGSIFELFTQVDGAKHRSQGGLGLGLPLVKSLVRMHGGSIAARSAGPNQGSEFEVRLPALERQAPAAVAVAPARPAERLRVLVVEDNHDGRESLRALLAVWGHSVEVAESGPQGLAKALAATPDVMLVDIGLPGFDGNELARRLRARLAGVVPLQLVAMTGFGQPEDRRQAREAGFDHYLVKPVDLDELGRILDAVPRLHGQQAGAAPPLVSKPEVAARP